MEEEQKSQSPEQFKEKPAKPAPEPPAISKGYTVIEERYPALRMIAGIYRLLGCLIGAAGLIAFIAALQMEKADPILLVSALLGAPLLTLTAFAAAEGIGVFLDIEENTRRTLNKKK